MNVREMDRSRASRDKRYREYIGLKLLPYRNKEQEGRFCWLKRERKLDNHAAMTEQAK